MTKITMDGRYGTRGNPTQEVRVLAVDAELDQDETVVAIANGCLQTYFADGQYVSDETDALDLVPLQEPNVVWLNVYGHTVTGPFGTRKDANVYASSDRNHVLRIDLCQAFVAETRRDVR